MLCEHCGINEAQEPHPCPFDEEMDIDTENLCTCCEECEEECRQNT